MIKKNIQYKKMTQIRIYRYVNIYMIQIMLIHIHDAYTYFNNPIIEIHIRNTYTFQDG